jgi:hypothetical protein
VVNVGNNTKIANKSLIHIGKYIKLG